MQYITEAIAAEGLRMKGSLLHCEGLAVEHLFHPPTHPSTYPSIQKWVLELFPAVFG